MSTEMAKVPAWMETKEYKEIFSRHEKIKQSDSGEIALLEVTPASKQSFGGFGVMGRIVDKYKNVVLDTKNLEDRMWIPPAGAMFRFDKEEDLKWIYALLYCPLYRDQCVMTGETPIRNRHRYVLSDAEKESLDYAGKREEAIKYQNTLYTLPEDTINLLCTIASIPSKASLGVKRADLCKVWENDENAKSRLKSMMDNPDIEYHIIAHWAIGQGKPEESKGFYKTQSGVYKHNEQILGNSIDNVIAYLKTNDEVFFALKKAKSPTTPAPSKPK